jgi:uncharacterized membrane protein YdjX (TVP38/TMEM64 family)
VSLALRVLSRLAWRALAGDDAVVLEVVKNPVAYFAAMVVVLSAASLPPSPPTLMAAKANPAWLVATLGAAAGAVAAVADHHLIRRAFRVPTLTRLRAHPLFERAERWAKVAPFFTVALFAAVPLPFMIPRVLVPLSGYPLPRYAAAVALGRWPRVFVIAAFGRVVDVPAWMLEAAFACSLGAAVMLAALRRLGWLGSKRE